VAAGESVTAICAAPDMPCRSAIHHWTRAFPAFAEALAAAREAQADWCADQVLIAAEEVTPATLAATSPPETPQRLPGPGQRAAAPQVTGDWRTAGGIRHTAFWV